MRSPHALALALLALTSAACGPHPERARSHRRAPLRERAPLRIELDERPVWVGEVIERVESHSYVYLRLSIISDSSAPKLRAHADQRWVAIEGEGEGEAPALGERVRVRSLARRSGVWEPTLGRDFEVLEYVAVLTEPGG